MEKYNDLFCYFEPPSGWNYIDPDQLSPQVKVGFVGTREGMFCPTMNLAVEKISPSMTLKQYLQAVKKIHKADKNTQWRDLGPLQSRAGRGEITELVKKEKGGNVRMLQFILVKDGYAYILTAATLKDHFKKHSPQLLSSIRSLTLTENLIDCIPSPQNREILKKALQNLKICSNSDKNTKKKSWEDLQSIVLNNFKDMGQHWQILMTKQAYETYLQAP